MDKITQMWSFELPDGRTTVITLDWKYVPYYKELQDWVSEHWDEYLEDKVNWERFYAAAERFVETSSRPKHPIGWVLDKVREHMDEPD